jgi:hypothetical protein
MKEFLARRMMTVVSSAGFGTLWLQTAGVDVISKVAQTVQWAEATILAIATALAALAAIWQSEQEEVEEEEE